MPQLANRVQENTSTTGTGAVTVGGATSSDFRTFASANLTHSFPYYINDANGNWEEGRGTYSGGVVTRAIVEDGSSGAATPISLSGNAVIGIDLNAGLMNDIIGEPLAVPPNAFPNLVLWLDAANATGATWTDSSGAANNCTQATAANQPTITSGAINGLPAVSFNGSSFYYNCPYTGEIATLLIVYNIAANSQGAYALMGGNTSASTVSPAYSVMAMTNPGNAVCRRQFSRSTGYDIPAANNSWVAQSSPITGPFNIFGVINDGNDITLFNNSHQCGPAITAPNSPTLPITASVIGASFVNNAVADFHNGHIAMVLAWSSALTPQQFSQVEAWVEQKYALQDPTGTFLYGCFEANGTNENLVLLTGNDGINWKYRPSNYVPVWTAGNPGGLGSVRDVSIHFINGALYATHTGAGNGLIPLAVCTDGFNFTMATYIDCTSVIPSNSTTGDIWAPEFFEDSDGSFHIFFSASTTASSDTGFQIYEVHPVDNLNLAGAWSTPVVIAGTNIPADSIDPFMTKLGNTYNLWCEAYISGVEYIWLFTSTSLTSGFTPAYLGGFGYTTAPTVTFGAAPSGGTTATGTATITNGVVTSVTITSGGSGYTSAPTITFSAAPSGGLTATATTTITSGAVTGVVFNSGNWMGTGSSVEAPCCFNTGGENWILLSDHLGNGMSYQTNSTVALSDTTFPATGWSAPANVNAPFTPQHGTVIRTPSNFFK